MSAFFDRMADMTENMTNDSSLSDDIKQENVKSIFQCWTEAISRFFDGTGRTTRYEFWAFQSVSLLIFIAAALCGFIFSSYKIIFEIFALYFVAPATAAGIRRLHDIGLSGFWMAPFSALGLWVLLCWEFEIGNLILAVFAFLCYISYIYWLLSFEGEKSANLYGDTVNEPRIYDQDSMVFVWFMAAFLLICWLVFIIKLF